MLQTDNRTPRFSVIIPSYNRPQLLFRAVRSVLAQTWEDFEVIVIDDASSVSYDEVIESLHDQRLRTLKLPINGGPAGARNAGIHAATGTYIAFLDDDDEFLPSFLSETLHAFAEYPKANAFSWTGVRTVSYSLETNAAIASRDRTFEGLETEVRRLQELMSIGTGFGVSIGRECLLQVGVFDESLRCTEDTDLFIRLIASKYQPTVIPSVQTIIHDHLEQRSTAASMNQARIAEIRVLFEKHKGFFALYPALRDQLRQHMEALKAQLEQLVLEKGQMTTTTVRREPERVARQI